jgi:hypothetical protein
MYSVLRPFDITPELFKAHNVPVKFFKIIEKSRITTIQSFVNLPGALIVHTMGFSRKPEIHSIIPALTHKPLELWS